jgi:hypothetical protein
VAYVAVRDVRAAAEHGAECLFDIVDEGRAVASEASGRRIIAAVTCLSGPSILVLTVRRNGRPTRRPRACDRRG